MARFGKMAGLELHKSSRGVPCIVSWIEGACSGSDGRGGSSRYYVEVQRYQGDVSDDDAKAGKADSNPYIVNKRMTYNMGGSSHSKIDHQTSLYGGAMQAIMSASQNDVITDKYSMKSAFAQATANASGKDAPEAENSVKVHHYFVKLNVGFGNNEAYIYIPKSDVLSNSTGKNMPQPAGEFTREMLDRHNHITQISKDVAQALYGAARTAESQKSERDIPEVADTVNEDIEAER